MLGYRGAEEGLSHGGLLPLGPRTSESYRRRERIDADEGTQGQRSSQRDALGPRVGGWGQVSKVMAWMGEVALRLDPDRSAIRVTI